jgi:hydrogenase maturation protein HypF
MASESGQVMMIKRLQIIIKGAVQGVGFRPFIYRLAENLNLKGYVINSSSGVNIEIEGLENNLRDFIKRIETEKPVHAIIISFEYTFLDPIGYDSFEIKNSITNGEISALILPDISVCNDCLNEMFNPKDRRYLYPFINCTNCGPRFSIIEKIPYDRPNTSMKNFNMCDDCRQEYENPLDRRFHAQPIACPNCGPHLEFWDYNGKVISSHNEALLKAIEKIRQEKIIALKGLGGFQLIVDARKNSAVEKLREKKHRDEKPFALMFPNLDYVKSECNVSEIEQSMLLSPESPIVILKRGNGINNSIISKSVASKNPYLGIMLPYTPLHHLLMRELDFPIVATSGNLSEEPMCIDEYEALDRLKSIADFYLVHNRPIVRHVDDTIVKSVNNRKMILRRARGFAPLPLEISNNYENDVHEVILAVGGHLKNTIAIKKGKNIFVSQHIGDLSNNESYSAFKRTITDFEEMYFAKPETIVTDIHPEYLSTKYAASTNLEHAEVQHHYAHIAACRLENQIECEALGVSWDGTGFGLDKSIWGGEFFYSNDYNYKHVAQFRRFMLPGGEIAIKEPRRTVCGLLYEIFGDDFIDHLPTTFSNNFSRNELSLIQKLLSQKINSPRTSSVGRLFDVVSSLLNICNISNYEGQAAMMLEFIVDDKEQGSYPFQIIDNRSIIVDWQPTIENILSDLSENIQNSTISVRFHNTLAKIILSVAEKFELKKVILSGGCFQNSYLSEKTIKILEDQNFQVYWHQRIPPNDGGISVGQIAAYLMSKKPKRKNLEKAYESKG